MRKLTFTEKLLRYIDPRSAVYFWHRPVAEWTYDYRTLGDYYIDFTSKLKYRGPYDKSGIPMLNYLGEIGLQYNPCAISQWGIGAFQIWRRTGAISALNRFELAVKWLLDNQEPDGTWPYRFPLCMYGVTGDWISGLAQAQAASLLYRHGKFLSSEASTRAADLGVEAMVRSIENRGTLREWSNLCAIEEVVSDRPSVILDGFIFSIFGLTDHMYVHSSSKNAVVLERCLATLIELLFKDPSIIPAVLSIGSTSQIAFSIFRIE